MNENGIWKPIVAVIIALLVCLKFYDLTNNILPYAIIFTLMLFVVVIAGVIRVVQFL